MKTNFLKTFYFFLIRAIHTGKKMPKEYLRCLPIRGMRGIFKCRKDPTCASVLMGRRTCRTFKTPENKHVQLCT